jgi:DNA (cytosine-5)-methyltransferase 1
MKGFAQADETRQPSYAARSQRKTLMSKLKVLDLFCKAGGCSRGYEMAGFEPVGVDINFQPRYPYSFLQADAIQLVNCLLRGGHFNTGGPGFAATSQHFYLNDFAFIHASPPCQAYSTLAAMHPGKKYPDQVGEVRRLLELTGLPYVIENVPKAPLQRESDLFGHGVLLCGSMFDLGVKRGELRRHRVFETNFPVQQPACRHRRVAVGVYGHGGHTGKPRMLYRKEASEAMEIDWMTRDEMAQAIPPAYTRFLGLQIASILASPNRSPFLGARLAVTRRPLLGPDEPLWK